MAKISLTLDQYLKKHGISRYELEKCSGISTPTIRSYCRNTVRRYDADVLEKICETLKCNLWDILEFIEENESDNIEVDGVKYVKAEQQDEK